MAGGLVAVVLWGLAPVATRSLVAYLSPLPLLVIRLPVAGLVLLPWALPVFRGLRRRHRGRLVMAGLLGLVGYNLPVTVGLQWLPASTAGLLLGTEPLWVLAFGALLTGERIARREWLGATVALGGTVVLAGPGLWSPSGGRHTAVGIALVLAGTLAFGAYTVVLRPLSAAYGALPATAASTVIGAVPYLALAGTISLPSLAHLPGSSWAELGFLSLGSTAAGMLLWNGAVLAVGSARLGMLLYLEPLVSVAGAIALLGEGLPVSTITGGLVLLAGVLIANVSPGASGERSGPLSVWRPVQRFAGLRGHGQRCIRRDRGSSRPPGGG
jgi:drug/metabolite transporter (DMT)-like permease